VPALLVVEDLDVVEELLLAVVDRLEGRRARTSPSSSNSPSRRCRGSRRDGSCCKRFPLVSSKSR
jgi:hypothetical protein